MPDDECAACGGPARLETTHRSAEPPFPTYKVCEGCGQTEEDCMCESAVVA